MRLSTIRTVLPVCGLIVFLLIIAAVWKWNRNSGATQQKSSIGDSYYDLDGQELITDCITKKVLGRIPLHLDAVSFAVQANGSGETGEERLASFQRVANERQWVGKQSDPKFLSGPGSTLLYAQEAMAGLHTILSEIKQKFGLSRVRLLDVPCGDMVWMSRFLKTRDDVDYTGYDIVPELIARHRKNFKGRRWKFYQRDIVENAINETFDLIFSRMMLQHLLNQDVLKALRRFSESGSRFLLTTTFPRIAMNAELKPNSIGRYRFLNLEIPPVFLVPPTCIFRDGEDGPSGGDIHFLALWKLPLSRIRDCPNVTAFALIDRGFAIHSCVDWTLNN